MTHVIDVLPTPADLVLASLPAVVAPQKRCSCLHSNTFARVSQVASVLFAGIALLSVVLMSTGVAPLSVETYGFCVVVFLLGAQNAVSLQSKIELGGYDVQNKRFKAQNDRLADEINRLAPIESVLRQTLLDARAEVDRVKLAATALETDLATLRVLNESQSKQVDDLRAENIKLSELIGRQEAILNKFEETLTREIASLGDKVSAIDRSVDRLRVIEAKFALFVDVSVELKGQVVKLQEMQVGLQGILTAMSKGQDLSKNYLEREEALQRDQAQIVLQFKELASKEAAFVEREAELLRRLEVEVTALKTVVREHARKSEHLVLRIIPLKVQNVRFADILEYVTSKNPELVEEARQEMRRRKLARLSAA